MQVFPYKEGGISAADQHLDAAKTASVVPPLQVASPTHKDSSRATTSKPPMIPVPIASDSTGPKSLAATAERPIEPPTIAATRSPTFAMRRPTAVAATRMPSFPPPVLLASPKLLAVTMPKELAVGSLTEPHQAAMVYMSIDVYSMITACIRRSAYIETCS